jgi:chemotaxis protein methyltransferase CheR
MRTIGIQRTCRGRCAGVRKYAERYVVRCGPIRRFEGDEGYDNLGTRQGHASFFAGLRKAPRRRRTRALALCLWTSNDDEDNEATMAVTGLSDDDVVFLRDLVLKRSAIVLDESKDYLIETRLERLAQDLNYPSLAALVADARRDAGTITRQLIEAMTTHETLFFRDVKPFEALKREILPALIAARQSSRQLSIWSAACSTGQEIFSVAMLLREHFSEVTSWPAKLYATDLSVQVLERAMQGRFQQLEVNRGLPAAMLVKYFDRDGVDWKVKDDIRKMVRFEQLNLLHLWPGDLRPDIVLLRNVLIYFNAATKKDILARVRQVMRPDGALVLGSAETTLGVDDAWERAPGSSTPWFRLARQR